jgi:Tol biopolymer transport system component
MSPEQARGEVVDHRTDIFSLGVVLYEMLTRELPFVAPSVTETVYRVIHEPAPPLARSTAGRYSAHLQRVLERCLAKDPRARYASVDELAADLRRLDKRLGVKTSTRILRWAGVAASVGVFGWVGLSAFREPAATSDVLRFARPVRLTSTAGTEDYPVWSPDGKYLAFQSNQSGNWDIWVSPLKGGEPENKTADHTGDDRFPSWSPDGSQIAFWSDREAEGYFVMPASGGRPRKVIRAAAEGPAHWSRNGNELTFIDSTTYEVFLKTVTLDGVERRRIRAPGKSVSRLNASWSPDERFVAYLDAGAYNSAVHPLLLLRVQDGASFSITDGTTRIWTASWSPDGRRLYYTSDRGGSSDLWEQTIGRDGAPEGEPRRITTALGVRSAVFSPDGRKVAYSQGQRSANLWKVPILEDRPAPWRDARQLTFDEALIAFVSVSPDRTRLFFSSNRRGSQDLWSASVEGGEPQRITSHPAQEFAPVLSPDGGQIAFYSDRGGNRDLWVMPADGVGADRQLTNDPAQDFHPDWSPDGRWLAFMSMRAGSRDIWAIAAEGGSARQLTRGPELDHFPNWSPDGKSLIFLSRRDGDLRLWRVAFPGGKLQQMTKGPAQYPRWSVDGKRIYFIGFAERTNNIWALDVETGAEWPLTDFTGRPGTLTATALATDGKSLFFSWDEDPGDVWVVDVEKPR